jgi:outer membrane protein TolC
MKVLHLLITLYLLSSSLALGDDKLDLYISDIKKEQFKYDYKKNEAESSKLRDSWIAPINLNYTQTKSNPYDNKQMQESAGINLNQKIFQSGGIYYGIKYADASEKYINNTIDVTKRKLVKKAISILMQIKQVTLKIKKQELLIKNSQISLEQKKEQYLNGQLDSGFLNNAIIGTNKVIQNLYNLQTNKQRLISSFKAISDINYKEAYIPFLNKLSQEEFLKHNIVLNLFDSEIKKNGYFQDITRSKYLPVLKVTAGYQWQKSEDKTFFAGSAPISQETEYYSYGFKVNVPIDINSFRDVESSRVNYLKSKVSIIDKKREIKAIYEQVMQNIENLEKKKQLSVENKDLYNSLLKDTKEQFKAGYKASFDVELLQNSLNIEELNVDIYEIDKQLELLTLYEMYKNEI